jgi:hypothetical protein
MRRVIIVGTLDAWKKKKRKGDEVWGCNACADMHDNLDRLYIAHKHEEMLQFMGKAKRKNRTYASVRRSINASGAELWAIDAFPGVKGARIYPFAEICERIGYCEFTSTIAYMVAHAILENECERTPVDEIVIHRVFCMPQSVEYINQVPNLNAWLGIAMGKGIKLSISADSSVMKSLPWESGLYGLVASPAAHAVNAAVATAIVGQMHVPNVRVKAFGKRTDEFISCAQKNDQIRRYDVPPLEVKNEGIHKSFGPEMWGFMAPANQQHIAHLRKAGYKGQIHGLQVCNVSTDEEQRVAKLMKKQEQQRRRARARAKRKGAAV